jgi:uncharacterized protein YigE (DUF2233 family)
MGLAPSRRALAAAPGYGAPMRLLAPLVATLSLLAMAASHADPPVQSPPPACEARRFEGDGFIVCRYDPASGSLRLVRRGADGTPGSLPELRAALGDDAARVAFAMNAGMYDPDRNPVGLWVEAVREARPLNRADGRGNFFLKPNGVFWVGLDGMPHIDETSAFAMRDVVPAWATQSGPLLVSAGRLHPAIDANGTSLAIRNGVGVHGGQALFAISEGRVSFGRFARFLKDALGCDDALYLDGAVSSLWSPELGRLDRHAGLGTFVVVLRAPQARPPSGEK